MGFFKRHKKIIAYTICGLLATFVNSLTYWVFTTLVDLKYSWAATALAWLFSVIFAFVTNKLFVFKSRSFHPRILFTEATSFILARFGTGLLDIAFMMFFVDVIKLDGFNDLADDGIKLLSTFLVMILNYFLSEFIVFRKKHISPFAKILFTEGIEYYACIPLSSCKITKKHLLDNNDLDEDSTVIMMLFPYRTKQKSENLSAYASVKDYHAFVDTLSDKLEAYVLKKYPTAKFKVFSDHSPIDEVHAACISGLGFMGDNGLLINERYSSFVFVGECITNLSPKQLGLTFAKEEDIKTCLHCGNCKQACPSNCIAQNEDGKDASNKKECLSAITQKKGELSDEEIQMMLDSGCIWGCDVCQNVCPYTKNAKYTPIRFFNEDIITRLDTKLLSNMSNESFKIRPFSWRGKTTIQRNVSLWEEHMNAKDNKSSEEQERGNN